MREERWQQFNSRMVHSVEQVIGASFWTPSRVVSVLSVDIDGRWAAWTTDGLVALALSTFCALSSGSLRPATLEEWTPAVDFRDTIEQLGYPLVDAASPTPTLHECLIHRSNDYSMASGICSALLGFDIVFGDGDDQAIAEASGSLSVVIPCYDSAATVYRVVEAVVEAAQHLPTGVTCEVIVVDDASLRPLATDRFPVGTRVVHSYTRLYAGAARNIGLSLAQGQTVVFLDSDTFIAPNYLVNHWLRHQLCPNLLLVSLRDSIEAAEGRPQRAPALDHDTRWQATYTQSWKGLNPVEHEITVRPVEDTAYFKAFGYGRTVGPTDLPFMVKGNNLSTTHRSSLDVRFPPGFEGWGPEDVCFAAKLIARGAFVIPVLSTGVFHVDHPPRSGAWARREEELMRNLQVYAAHLQSSALDDWEEVR
jgi:hypothetical protein